MGALLPARFVIAIALELSWVASAPPGRTSRPERLRRSPRRQRSMLFPRARTSGPNIFRRVVRRPLHPECYLHKGSRGPGQIPDVLKADLPSEREELIPWPSWE